MPMRKREVYRAGVKSLGDATAVHSPRGGGSNPLKGWWWSKPLQERAAGLDEMF